MSTPVSSFYCSFQTFAFPYLDDTKAVIRFDLKTADWIPERVRNRMAQKYCTSMNARGEFIVTSMATRSAVSSSFISCPICRLQIENMEDCYSKLREQLREVSLELVKERRREYISPEYAMELENRFANYILFLI